MNCTNAHIGKLQAFGLAVESTRGTKSAPKVWLPLLSGGLKSKVETKTDESGMGVIEQVSDSQVIKEMATLSAEAIVRSTSIPQLLKLMYGTHSVTVNADTSGTVHDWTFSIQQDNSHPSFTGYKQSPIGTEYSTFMMMDEIGFSAEKDDYLKVNFSAIGQQLNTDGTQAVGYDAGDAFMTRHMTVKYADTLAGLDSATAIQVEGLSFNVSKNVSAMGVGRTPDCFVNKSLNYSGTIKAKLTNNEWLNLVKAANNKFFRVEFLNEDVTIGASTKPMLKFDFAKVIFSERDQSDNNDEVVEQTIGFVGMMNNTEGFSSKGYVTTTTASL